MPDEKNIGRLITEALFENNLQAGVNDARIIDAWNRIIGENIRRQIDKTFVRNGILYVDVSNSALRQELHFQRTRICGAINNLLKEQVLKEIVLK